ncbi:MAG TPA: hypothetical protein PKO06_07290 [Candidatus Ozemobacteraceae bacterium]|nr:hypothetical protein [Candidatus Ozemobacteraceae bacterium]
MKKLNLRVLGNVLKGLLNGSIELIAVPTGKKAVRMPVMRAAKPKKPGRKPLSPSAKKIRQMRAKARLVRQAKKSLPAPRDVFLALEGKTDGLKLSQLSNQFKVKRNLLRDMLDRLVAKEDLATLKGRYFLARRLRHKNGDRKERQPPISEKQILDYLKKHQKASLTHMTSALKEKSYQRLIRVINSLRKSKKVVKDGKEYRLAD